MAIGSSSEQIARDLLEIGAVMLRPDQPFTWASGRPSPVYTDNRLTLGYPELRKRLTDRFEALARPFEPDVVVGTATAGIPHAAWLADRLGLPLAYVRASPKAHGTESRIEGKVRPGQRAIVVEDLISTGGSALSAAESLRLAGVMPLAVLSVFSYGFEENVEAFRLANMPVHVLTTFDTLIQVAKEDGSLSGEALAALESWRESPKEWRPRTEG